MPKLTTQGCLFVILAGLFGLAASGSPADQGPDDLVIRLQAALEARDLDAYLGYFTPLLREQETDFFHGIFDMLKMDRVSLYRARPGEVFDENVPLYVQAFFENSYSARFETWQLKVRRAEGQWQVLDRKTTGDISNLLKIRMPAERIERAARLEVRHADITLTFTDALVFYDNVPDLETALIVIGPGRVDYSPSVAAEKHQLELATGKRALAEPLESAFLRLSNHFFEQNIRLEKSATSVVASADELKKAYGIFTKHYPRSFTVENSLNQELLSFLPQGDEAVFEFRTKRGMDFTYIFSPFAQEEVHLFDRTNDRLINLYTAEEEDAEAGKKLFITFSQKFDIQRYDLRARFEPPTTTLSVKARLDVLSTVGELDSLKLRLSPEFEILGITDPQGRDLFYTQDRLRKILYVYLIDPIAKDAVLPLDIEYRGTLMPPIQPTDVLALPQIQDTYILIPPKYETYLYSQAALWYPAPAEDDFFSARLEFTVPSEFQCIANGLLLDQRPLAPDVPADALQETRRPQTTYLFETRNPVKYLTFIVGKFLKDQESPGSPPLSYYLASNTYLQSQGLFEATRPIIQFYEQRFGSFPFEKLDVVHRLWPAGGGHSPASFVVLNEIPRVQDSRLPINPQSPVDLTRWREYFLAHEIAHQWWGQGVTWQTYHDQWLSEGLAQFASALFLREKYGDKAYAGILKKFSQWTEKKATWGPITLGSRLSYLDFDAYQAILYNKTALVLNMLLDWLGPKVFFDAVQEFFESHKFKAARTGAFRQALEKRSGLDLKPFFQGWFDSHLLPQARLSTAVEKTEEGWTLRVAVEQLADVFVYPLVLEWTERGAVRRHTMLVDKKKGEFIVQARSKPEDFRANPDKAVPGVFLMER